MSPRVQQAAVLVGGLGTRLGELTAQTPKPLLEVAGRPFLDVLLAELGRHGFRQILLLAGFAGAQVEAYAQSTPTKQRFDLDIKVIVEQQAAGTGGALRQAAPHLAATFLAMNGDSWLDFNLLDLVAAQPPGDGWGGVLALRHVADAARFGVVECSGAHITRFLERPEKAGAGLVNGGVYLFNRSILDRFPEKCSLEKDMLPALAHAGCLYGRAYGGFFLDIGIPEAFGAAQNIIPQQQRRGAVFFDRDGVLNIDKGHVGQIDRFEWMPGAIEAVKMVNDAGLFAFVVSNQAGVAKGKYIQADIAVLEQHMAFELAQAGAHIDAFSYCPDHPEAIVEAHRRVSPRRKPAPGMLLDLMAQWPVDAGASLMIGDQPSDMAAAKAAGIRPYLFAGGRLDRFLAGIPGVSAKA